MFGASGAHENVYWPLDNSLMTHPHLLNAGLSPLYPVLWAPHAAHTWPLMRPGRLLSLAGRASPSIHTDAPSRALRAPTLTHCCAKRRGILRRPRHSRCRCHFPSCAAFQLYWHLKYAFTHERRRIWGKNVDSFIIKGFTVDKVFKNDHIRLIAEGSSTSWCPTSTRLRPTFLTTW